MPATLHECILYTLTNDAGVCALASDRHYILVIDQDTAYPCSVISQIGDTPSHIHNGPPTITETRLQVSSFGKLYGDTKRLSVAIRACLEAFNGPMGPALDAIAVGACLLAHETDLYEGDSKTFHIAQEYHMLYSI